MFYSPRRLQKRKAALITTTQSAAVNHAKYTRICGCVSQTRTPVHTRVLSLCLHTGMDGDSSFGGPSAQTLFYNSSIVSTALLSRYRLKYSIRHGPFSVKRIDESSTVRREREKSIVINWGSFAGSNYFQYNERILQL